MTRPRLILLRPLGLGDFLTGVPAMRAVARAFPHHERLLVAPTALASLAMLSGAVDGVIEAAPHQPLPVSSHHPKVAIDLHGRGPASQRVLLATHPARLLAFRNDEVPETRGFPRWRNDEHEIHRWCRLLVESGIPADPGDLDLDPPAVEPPPIARGAVVIHPGAAYPARRWPAERWAAVAASLAPRVVLTGGRSERALATQVATLAGLDRRRVLAGRTDLLELSAIVQAADLVISADTGIAHLATAMRTPSVVLFGPTSPARWGPPPERHWHRVIWKGREGDPHGMQPDPGLLEIGVADVLDAVDSLREMPIALRA